MSSNILVVDDEPIVREVVCRYLERESFTTLEAGDGEQALRLYDGLIGSPRETLRLQPA